MVLVIVIILTNNKNKKYSIFSKGEPRFPLDPSSEETWVPFYRRGLREIQVPQSLK